MDNLTTSRPKKATNFGNPRQLTSESRRKRAEYLAELSGWACHYCQRELNSCQEIASTKRAEMLYGHGMIGYYGFRELMQGIDPDPKRLPTLDHKLPQSKGGTHEIDNLVLCCRSCNSQKGFSRTYESFLAMNTKGAV